GRGTCATTSADASSFTRTCCAMGRCSPIRSHLRPSYPFERRGADPMLDHEFHLVDDFRSAKYDDWRALAEADLAGASFEQKLVTHSYEGIDLLPVYTH